MSLAGCKKLVVFLGQTYLSRLWCLVELFVFLEMDKDVEDIEIRNVSSRAIEDILSTFDANDADCYLREEKAKMLTLIEAGFGSLEKFNDAVKRILSCSVTESDGLIMRFDSSKGGGMGGGKLTVEQGKL
jgi:hypothetical protein